MSERSVLSEVVKLRKELDELRTEIAALKAAAIPVHYHYHTYTAPAVPAWNPSYYPYPIITNY